MHKAMWLSLGGDHNSLISGRCRANHLTRSDSIISGGSPTYKMGITIKHNYSIKRFVGLTVVSIHKEMPEADMKQIVTQVFHLLSDIVV